MGRWRKEVDAGHKIRLGSAHVPIDWQSSTQAEEISALLKG